MVNYRKCKITRKNVTNQANLIAFGLNIWKVAKDGGGEFILCTNSYPFNTYQEGDCVEIDLDKTKLRDNSYKFDDASVLRKIFSQEELDEQIFVNKEISLMLDNFCQQTLGKKFGYPFDRSDLSSCQQILNQIANKFDEINRKKGNLELKISVLQDESDELTSKLRSIHNEKKEKEDEVRIWREKLEREQRERRDERTNYNSEKLEWERTKGELQTEKVRVDERLEASNSQVVDLRGRLTNSENQLARLEMKSDEKNVVIQNLNNQLTELRIESGSKENELKSIIKDKESELKKKEEIIEQLKENLGTTQKTAFDEKIQFKEEKLETLAEQLGIELRRIQTLRRRYKELLAAQEDKNSSNINTAQDNITAIKESLQEKGITIGNVQRICKKCKRIAQLELQLGQQPQPNPSNNNKKDWTNINSNFTPELIQEWTNHNFTYQQCQEWININPALQQNQAIKEPAYYAWLRDIKQVTAEWVLNEGNERALSLEFFRWYQEQQQKQYQNQQEQATNNS